MKKALSVFAALMAAVALVVIFNMPKPSQDAQGQKKTDQERQTTESKETQISAGSAIEQAKRQADIEKNLDTILKELGINCGLFIVISAEQCAEFVKRVRSDQHLSHVIRQAKENRIPVTPTNNFDVSNGMIYIDRHASTEEIVKFMRDGQKK